MSVKEISAKAVEYEFNQNIPLKYWLRTADTLLREVSSVPNQDRRVPRAGLLTLSAGAYLRTRRQ